MHEHKFPWMLLLFAYALLGWIIVLIAVPVQGEQALIYLRTLWEEPVLRLLIALSVILVTTPLIKKWTRRR